eukprot:GHVL01043703.1.p2 GENE.GHVL01043703.1~~GHVL01043703.1.p2  ORF type:complete len:295 (-),score=34.46 GHVL01043703.1:112-996(-)
MLPTCVNRRRDLSCLIRVCNKHVSKKYVKVIRHNKHRTVHDDEKSADFKLTHVSKKRDAKKDQWHDIQSHGLNHMQLALALNVLSRHREKDVGIWASYTRQASKLIKSCGPVEISLIMNSCAHSPLSRDECQRVVKLCLERLPSIVANCDVRSFSMILNCLGKPFASFINIDKELFNSILLSLGPELKTAKCLELGLIVSAFGNIGIESGQFESDKGFMNHLHNAILQNVDYLRVKNICQIVNGLSKLNQTDAELYDAIAQNAISSINHIGPIALGIIANAYSKVIDKSQPVKN